MKLVLLSLLPLFALACSTTAPPSSPRSPSVNPAAPSTWSLTTTVGAEQCELSKAEQRLTWRCGDGVQREVQTDVSAVVQKVEAIDWPGEAPVDTPEQVGPSRRQFRLQRGTMSIEVFRYPGTGTPVGALGSAFDRWLAAERSSRKSAPTAPAPRKNASASFPVVADRGLVTLQEISLGADEPARTIRVDASGEWSSSLPGAQRGKLTAEELGAVKSLLDEASSAGLRADHSSAEEACEAMPDRSIRVLYGKDREEAWRAPCASLPAEVFVVLSRYLRQVAEGRPAQEREQMIRQWKAR